MHNSDVINFISIKIIMVVGEGGREEEAAALSGASRSVRVYHIGIEIEVVVVAVVIPHCTLGVNQSCATHCEIRAY